MTATAVVEPNRLGQWRGLAVFYAAVFAVLGVYMQFFPVWLHDARSLEGDTIAIVLSAQTVARTIAGPLWAQRADRTGQPRRVLQVLSLLSVFAFATFAVMSSVTGLLCSAFVFGCVYPPMHPILDALALQTAHRAGFAYGRVRMVGSLSFLLSIVLVGWWLGSAPSTIVFWILITGMGLSVLAGAGLPKTPVPAHEPPAAGPARPQARLSDLLRRGPFVMLLVTSALIQGSHATYYNLSTVHWTEHGIDKGIAGVLWAEGVLAEIVLFYFARGRFERLRPTTLLAIGGVGAAVRWIAIGCTTSLPLLLASNWLHALSFTCTYLGALRALERRVEPQQRATAQGLLGAANSGVGMATCGLLGGFVYRRWAGRAFFLMAAFALLGTGLAFLLRRNADRAAQLLQANTPNSPE